MGRPIRLKDSEFLPPALTLCSAQPTWVSRPNIVQLTTGLDQEIFRQPGPATFRTLGKTAQPHPRKQFRNTAPSPPPRATSNAPNWPKTKPAFSPACML